MKPEQIKALLIEKLSTYYDGAIHSSVDLSMRDEIADKGKEIVVMTLKMYKDMVLALIDVEVLFPFIEQKTCARLVAE